MKKRKNIFKVVALTVLMLFALTGCIRVEYAIKLNKNGTGSFSTVTAMEEGAYNSYVEQGTDPFEGQETKTITIDGEKYIAAEEVIVKDVDFKELSEKLLKDSEGEEMGVEESFFSSAEISKNGNKFTFKIATTGEGLDTGGMGDASEMLDMFIKVEMPGKITSQKGGKIDKNTVIFEIEDFEKKYTFEAYSTVGFALSNSLMIIVICVVAAFVVILAIVIIIVVVNAGKKKKLKTETVKEENTETEIITDTDTN